MASYTEMKSNQIIPSAKAHNRDLGNAEKHGERASQQFRLSSRNVRTATDRHKRASAIASGTSYRRRIFVRRAWCCSW